MLSIKSIVLSLQDKHSASRRSKISIKKNDNCFISAPFQELAVDRLIIFQACKEGKPVNYLECSSEMSFVRQDPCVLFIQSVLDGALTVVDDVISLKKFVIYDY